LLSAGCAAIDDLLNSPSDLAIQKFSVSPKELTPGTTATLSWDVKGAEEVQIDNGIGAVKSKGSMEVRAERSTTYTLLAKRGTASASSSLQVVVAGTTASPSPSPSPSVTPTPTPTPTPIPTPTPTPTPTPSPSPSGGCRLSSMAECGRAEGPKGVWGCCREERTQVFADDVERAIDKILQERPELFNGDRPKDDNAYIQGVAKILERDFGYCAKQGGPEDEVGVKNSNGFSEQYDILLSNGRIRRFGYTVTCRPARF
jgi:hypothetical protein